MMGVKMTQTLWQRGASRREFLALAGGMTAWSSMPRPARAAGWDGMRQILDRIHAPAFPKKDFPAARYGAAADGRTDCTAAIARAIDACNRGGGGRVVLPAGLCLSGPVDLKSNVNLFLPAGATLLFTTDRARYLPAVRTRWEGTELMNYSALIRADGQQNIAVTGEGTLDGGAGPEHWWPWSKSAAADRQALVAMGDKDIPAEQRLFGEGHFLRPSLFQPRDSRNILMEGVTVKNSPMWQLTPLYCSNVIIRGVQIVGHGPNNDGCDPDSCTDVLIDNCTFDTGDDCIAIKSGRNRDGRRVARPTENVVIRGCRMKDGHGGITIGSEASGGVRNVFVEDCRLDSPNLNQAMRFKTNAQRGGAIENIFFRNLTVGEVSNAVLQIDCLYEEGANGPEKPVVRNIEVRGVSSRKSRYALELRGLAASPIRDVRLADCIFENAAQPNVLENVTGLECVNVKINGQPFAPRG
jgi:polygalacturonase